MYTIGFAETVRDILKVRIKRQKIIVLIDGNLGSWCQDIWNSCRWRICEYCESYRYAL
jgi:hypothetical protein